MSFLICSSAMSTQEDNNNQQVPGPSLEIRISSADDKKNPYKKFDAKKREEVFMWINASMFLLAVVTCVASFTVPTLRKSRPRGIAMWQWSLLASVLLVGPLISRAIVKCVLFVHDREFSARENILYYVVELVESAWVVLWFTMILIAWLIVVDEPDYLNMPSYKSEKIIKKFNTTWPIINVTLITLILGSFLWLLKDLVVMYAKSSFHIKRFFVRISDALKYQSVVEGLSAYVSDTRGVVEVAAVANDDDRDDNNNYLIIRKCFQCLGIQDCIDMMMMKKKKNTDVKASCLDDVTQKDVSCWGMKKVIEWLIKHKYYSTKHHYIHDEDIDIDKEANTAAEEMFPCLADYDDEAQDRRHITWKGLEAKLSGLPPEKVSLLKVKQCLFDGDEAKEIEEKDLKKWMVKVYKHRESLVNALVANRHLFRTFNRFIDVILVIFIFALWLIMIRVETRNVMVFIGGAIVSAAVFFGDCCKKILDNLVFVFVMHTYDIGDYCLIDNIVVQIKEIHLFSTIALTFDNEIRHYPNSDLVNRTICNYTRSVDMADVIEFSIESSKKTNEIIDKLKPRIKNYIEDSPSLKQEHKWVIEPQDFNTKVKLHFRHKINFDYFDERESTKSELYLKIREIVDGKNYW